MGVEKLSISFDLALGEAVRGSASSAGQSVSTWLAEAARARLRQEALGDAVSAWEKRYGRLTEEEVAAAELVLQDAMARTPRRSRR